MGAFNLRQFLKNQTFHLRHKVIYHLRQKKNLHLRHFTGMTGNITEKLNIIYDLFCFLFVHNSPWIYV